MVPTSLALLLLLLGLSLPVAAALLILALALAQLFSVLPVHLAMGEIVWSASSNFLLVSVPLFILLGEILLRSGIADRLYASMSQWLSWLPGGLMHANIGACMVFAATSGSSVATAATIGTVATPVIEKYRYGERLFLGSLAAGGTLGILIPPSINLIIYGWLTETSVPQLYLAGFVPGIVLGLIFMATIVICCLIRPEWRGVPIRASWNERLRSLTGLLPPFALFLVVIGSIYAGFATPTESAALGVIAALGLAGLNRRLTLAMLTQAIDGTMRTTGMIMLIVAAAWFLNFVLSAIGLVGALNAFITGLGLSSSGMLGAIVIFYLVLGCFMEPLPMMIVTVPVVTPIIVRAGYDPVWFGIMIVLLCETAMVTPPVGVNLYVVQGVRGRGSIGDVILGVVPFIVSLILMILLIIAAPGIVLWLPRLFGTF
ncbi:MAG: TRAP transporter large permease [Microvirga sp.]|jgi:C4-dicarboxylate transporter DctM subunit